MADAITIKFKRGKKMKSPGEIEISGPVNFKGTFKEVRQSFRQGIEQGSRDGLVVKKPNGEMTVELQFIGVTQS